MYTLGSSANLRQELPLGIVEARIALTQREPFDVRVPMAVGFETLDERLAAKARRAVEECREPEEFEPG
jgi:hypothetical protein